MGERNRGELYDVRTDPAEQNDLAQAQPERLASLTAQWRQLDAEFARQAGPTNKKTGTTEN